MGKSQPAEESTKITRLERVKTLAKKTQSFIVTQFQTHKKAILIGSVIFIVVSGSILGYILKDIPNPQKLTRYPSPVSTQIFDRNGKLLYELYQDQNRTPVTIDQIPDSVKKATIAIEDKNFYRHHGLDFVGITRAAFKTLSGQRLEGGSTITQQLVKIALLEDPARTAQRKIREAVLALATEFFYSKDQILELYLNHIPYGGTTYGIESASHEFFNKKAKDLTLAESALLAGLPQAPSKYSPFGSNPERAKQRQKQVLKRMQEEGFITEEEYDKASKEELKFAENLVSIKAPHFVFWIKDLLIEKYGAEKVNTGGLRVTTSLDLTLQENAQASLSAEVTKIKRLKASNGAALVTKPKTGEVLAMIGSTNYFDLENDGNVNVTLRYRQPGSSIKPLNYATGLLLGWTPSVTYLDVPTCFNVAGQKAYCPKNYDGTFHGPVQMRFSLGNSYNIPAVKQLAMNGIDSFIATASAMGIQGWQENPDRYGLSLTLGGGEVRMVDLATAFGVFANGGVKVPLHPILKVETYKGEVLDSYDVNEVADYSSSQKMDWDSFWRQPLPLPNTSSSPTPTPTQTSNIFSFFKKDPTPTPPQAAQPTNIRQEIKTVLPEEVAYIISHMLLDNNARVGAFGTQNSLSIPKKTVSVKTGTTNDLRDNWTVGYTPDYLVSVWVGNNDNSPMSYIASGITGAAPIWNDIMRYILKSEKDHFPVQPKGVVSRQICTLTGLLPTPENPCDTRNEIFVDKVLPTNNYPLRRQIWVRRDNKLPLLPGDTTIDLDLEEHSVVSDPFQSEFCIDCAYPQETKPDPANPNNQIPTGKISYPTFNVDLDKFKATPPSQSTTPTPTPTPKTN
jgi:membrane peptidoglycan carboxypeptidase